MSKFFHLEREIRKVKQTQERLNESEDFQVFLDFSRDDENKNIKLLTIIKNLPKKIAQMM